MNPGIHKPLGTDRKPLPPRRPILTAGRLLASFAVIVVSGLSIYAATRPEKLSGPPALASAQSTTAAQDSTAKSEKADAAKAPVKLEKSRPLDGANVEKQIMDDGSVVTKYTPGKRDQNGPVIIDATADSPQDPRMAAMPDDALLENSPQGKLPIVAADGTRSVDRYARPWSGTRGTRIAIVVGGLGLSQTGTQRALKVLPEEITLGFAASGNSLSRWMQEARKQGHEILLQVPMQPIDYPDNDPGALTLLDANSADKNLKLLHESLGRLTNYTGVMNYQGGRFLADATALEPVMRDIGQRGLLFLDDGASMQSLSETYAKAFATPHVFADVQLDEAVNRTAILAKLDELERVAIRKGTAIGVASAFDESMDAIAEWAPAAAGRGIEIVGVSALAQIPQ